MKIINLKVSVSKILLFLILIIAIIFVFSALGRFLDFATKEEIVMTNENYTTILKDCHQNIDNYLGKRIHATGYVFRADDFKPEEFVLARDMLINSTEAQIVGFLCQYAKANEFEDNVWIEITGKITKGEYHGEMPIVQIESIKKITTPEEIFVHKP